MPERKKVIISVISDLVTDQRVHRTAITLHNLGMDVLLTGRKKKNSLKVEQRPYRIHRFKMVFERGFIFYAEFQFRLFMFLLFQRCDVLISNDLDTLLPNYLISKIKNARLIYDSHEYFTGVPELADHPFKRSIWKSVERFIFPKLKNVMTVNSSIAKLYSEEYNVDVKVVCNMPLKNIAIQKNITRKDLGLPENKTIFLLQGAGINVDRGGEEAIASISLTNAILLIIGGGDVIEKLKKHAEKNNLTEKVFFIPLVPLNELRPYTSLADFGLTLDKNTNLNYLNSLPNKLFDYIHAGLPVLATDLPEIKKIIIQYNIGLIASSSQPELLSQCMNEMMNNKGRIHSWKQNLFIAAEELCWENEQEKLITLFESAVS